MTFDDWWAPRLFYERIIPMHGANREDLTREGWDAGVAAERARCAALCWEAGCICDLLAKGAGFQPYVRPVGDHDPRCPDALAARIEALGGGKEE